MHAVVEERWREERRGRILAAAGRVFAARSFRDASMDEIAQEAHVGKPTLYRYFSSKDALFAAVFVETLNELEARLDRALNPEVGIEAQLVALVRELVPVFRHHLVPLPVPDGAAAALDQSRRRIFRERRARIASFFAAAIDAGMRRGEVRQLDAARVARLMIGLVWSAAASGQDAADVIGTEIADIILNGLAPRQRAEDGPGVWAEPANTDPERRAGGSHRLSGASA
jgi:AcrR family transcriptional regulator